MSVSSISSASTLNTNRSSAVSSGSNFASVLSSSGSSEVDLDSIFEAASKQYGVPVSLLKAVAKAESNFKANATSSCGAMGIMQLMPGTAKSLGVSNAYDPEQNIMGGAKYLGQLLSSYGGDLEKTVAAYNAGSGAVNKYGGVPPYQETINYVEKVLGYCGTDLSAGSVSTSALAGSSGTASSSMSGSDSYSYLQNVLSDVMGDSSGDNLGSMLLLAQMIALEQHNGENSIGSVTTE
jgi:hypothetical protein